MHPEKNDKNEMAKFFGKTWWSEKWLNALTGIDYANRIPRGSSYAKNGKVKRLQILSNKVSAVVQGSYNYFVDIEIPEFDSDRFEEFISSLLKKPFLISKLLNRELDSEILEIAEQAHLKIFPSRWSDFSMHCDCPDHAVPCKHIAAVIYIISREIDNNPFVVFKLHGIDLIEELKKRGLELDSRNLLEVPSIDCLIEKDKPKNDVSTSFSRIDFSVIGDNIKAINNLLPEETPFYPTANFSKKYSSQISLLSKSAQNILKNGSENWQNVFEFQRTYHIKIDSDFTFFCNSDFSFFIEDKFTKEKIPLYEILPEIFSISPDYLENYSDSVVCLKQLLLFALHLLLTGNAAPRVFKTPMKGYVAKWFAVTMEPMVATSLEMLDKNSPQDMLLIKPQGTRKFYPVKHSASLIVSLLLEFLVSNMANVEKNDRIMSFIFKGKFEKFNTAGETEIPGNIKAWTDRLFFNAGEYSFQLIVSELKGNWFSLDISVGLKKGVVKLSEILKNDKYQDIRYKILKELSLISHFLKDYQLYVNSLGQAQPIYKLEEFSEFLFSIAPSLRLLGIKILLPKSLQNIVRPKISMKIKRKNVNSKSYIRLDELLDFDWQVALGDNLMNYDDFLKLYKTIGGLVKIKQDYFFVNQSDIDRIKKIMDGKARFSKSQLLQAALSEDFDNLPVRFDKDAKELIGKIKNMSEIPVPKNINAVLRPYQQRGFQWLYKNFSLGFGSILADDMGLGKTLQTVVFLQKLKNDGFFAKKKALIVAPTGLISNWQSEFGRFAPEISVFTYHGIDRDIDKFSSDVLLTTYGIMRSDVGRLKKQKWAVMVIDEAQNIKNQSTAQTKAAFALSADSKIALSGTPVENRLSEFWSIMNFVNTGYLGSLKSFSENFANPIQTLGDKNCAEKLKKTAAPFMMRRLKTDKSIINDLPDKVERNEYAQLSKSQAAVYQKTLDEALQTIKGVKSTDSQSLFKRSGLILQMILSLKQICNHPALFLKNNETEPELSGKSEMLMDLVENIVESGQKALIFTQFKEMGDMLVNMIYKKLGVMPLFLHGGCSIEQRKNMVEKFQTQKQHQIFILSLKAAGTGLNLTAASHVIHYDLWWNPSVEAQATDRAYRIGQHQNVVVHRFITQNTFEEKIDKMIQDKKQLAEMTVAVGESWIGKLSDKELEELF